MTKGNITKHLEADVTKKHTKGALRRKNKEQLIERVEQLESLINKLQATIEEQDSTIERLKTQSNKRHKTIKDLENRLVNEFENKQFSYIELEQKHKDLEQAHSYLRENNDTLIKSHIVATKEIESLNDKLKKHRRSTKRRMVRLKNYQESKQGTINSLFDIYSTVLLEDNWNDRIDWKNDLLQSIQLLIQDIS